MKGPSYGRLHGTDRKAERARARGKTDENGERMSKAVALTIAGSDSGGGAGIQADLKTFQAFGVFGTSAITAVTAQNTLGVHAIRKVSPELVAAQIRAVAEDLRPAAAKTGMLADAEIISAVADAVERAGIENLVVDPVMVATSGDRLLDEGSVDAYRSLFPLAVLLTPNTYEAELLTGLSVRDLEGMGEAARRLISDGSRAVASGSRLLPSVDRALRYTRRALRAAQSLGGGSRPLEHDVSVEEQPT